MRIFNSYHIETKREENKALFVIFVNLNLDVNDQEVENVIVMKHSINDDIDQVCLLKEFDSMKEHPPLSSFFEYNQSYQRLETIQSQKRTLTLHVLDQPFFTFEDSLVALTDP